MIICRSKPEQQKQAIGFLLISGQLSFALSQVLKYLSLPWFSANSLDFIMGFLTGYSIVATIGFLFYSGKFMKLARKG